MLFLPAASTDVTSFVSGCFPCFTSSFLAHCSMSWTRQCSMCRELKRMVNSWASGVLRRRPKWNQFVSSDRSLWSSAALMYSRWKDEGEGERNTRETDWQQLSHCCWIFWSFYFPQDKRRIACQPTTHYVRNEDDFRLKATFDSSITTREDH